MNRAFVAIPVLASACIEYEPTSSLPALADPNPRPLEVTTQTDKLVQVQVPEVDILWTVDNSGSMDLEQAAISENNPVFMQYFLGSGLDYHIGVVSTDMASAAHQGRLVERAGIRWVDEDTANPSTVFASMIQLGTGGSSFEKGRDATYSALEIHKEGYNQGFVREDAGLHIVVVSDESDYSNQIGLAEFVGYLNTLKVADDMVTFSSIVKYPAALGPGCTLVLGGTPGDAYLAVTDAVGGISWNICEEDWVGVLEQLGIQASGLKREYFLSQLPVVDTIEVWVEEGEVRQQFERGTDWTYTQSRNSVTFVEYVPNALSEIYVEYEVLSANE